MAGGLKSFFGVVARPETWLAFAYHWLALPLGVVYFVFLVTGLAVGLGLVIIWVGIPLLLLVAGAWYLFAVFERVQTRYLLGVEVAPAPRSWESVDGVWAKLKAHFGNGSTWRDLVFLFLKLPLGAVSFVMAVTAMGVTAWLAAFPVAWYWDFSLINWESGQESGSWTPSWWAAVLGVPAAIVVFVAALHVLNAWAAVVARIARGLFGAPPAATSSVYAARPSGEVPPPAPSYWPAAAGSGSEEIGATAPGTAQSGTGATSAPPLPPPDTAVSPPSARPVQPSRPDEPTPS
jgi:hypothetical protein